jgi:hypothetical protein
MEPPRRRPNLRRPELVGDSAIADRTADVKEPRDAAADTRRVDAGFDGGDAPTVDARSACPSDPDALLCDNFDEGPLLGPWTIQSVAAGTLALSDAESVSPPSSLFAEITSADGGMTGEGSASLVFNIPRTYSRIRNSYDIYFDQMGARSAAIGSIYLIDGLRYYEVTLFARGKMMGMDIFEDGIQSDGGEITTPHPLTTPIPLDTWTRVILDIDFGPSPSFTLTLESPPGTPASPALDGSISPTITGTTMSVYGGIEYVVFPETTGWRIYVDNVVVDTP